MIPCPDAPRPGLRGQAGFALTEAIAAAAILAFLALGVLAGLDGAASSTGREKARAAASALAEKDQERLHAMRAQDLPDLRESKPATVGGTTFTVTSEVDWISDVTGNTLSCTSNPGKADYLRLRSTVSSSTVGSRTAPVKLESLVAPPIGSSGGNNGTLAVQVNNRDNAGVASLNVLIKGANTGYTRTEETNAVGCAIFAFVPADTYDVSVNTVGYVDEGGVQDHHASGQVTAGSTTVRTIIYDKAGSMKTGFDTVWWDPTQNSGAGAWRTTASSAWWLALENSRIPGGGVRKFQDTTAPIEPLATIDATNLFPFKDGYGVHTGPCTEENPKLYAEPWSLTNAFQLVDPALTYDRTSAPAKPIRQPALPVRVVNGKVNTTTYRVVGGANVVAKLLPPNDGSVCKDKEFIAGIVGNTTWGLQSYPTDRAPITGHPRSGTSASNYMNGLAGFVTKKPTNAVEYDPGLPFGRWQICASAYLSDVNQTRRAYTVIDNTATGGWATTYALDLNNTTNPPSDQGSCPTSAASGWPAAS